MSLELLDDGLVLELVDDDGAALDPEALPLAGWLGVELELEDEVLGVLGVALDPALELGVLGVALDPALELGVLVEPELLDWSFFSTSIVVELEDEPDGAVLGVALELDEDEPNGAVLGVALELDEAEPDGLDIDPEGAVLEPDEDELGGVEAPRGAAVSVRLQPYRPLTARAIGRTTNAVFFIRLMG